MKTPINSKNNPSLLIHYLLLLNFILQINSLQSLTVGSDSTIEAPQASIFFPKTENDTNKISNYAVMDNGFVLEDVTTTCSVYSIFPMNKYVSLNGGRMYLSRDIEFGQNLNLASSGKFYGNNFEIRFPKSTNVYELPNGCKTGATIDLIDKEPTDNEVYSVSWSYDDKYIAAGSKSTNGNELAIIYFDGLVLTTTIALDLGNSVNSVSWHPSSYYLAVGRSKKTGTEIKIYQWNVHNGTLTISDEIEINYNVKGVEWSTDGQYLAATSDNSVLQIYSFSNGTLTPVTSISFAGSGTPTNNAVSWESNNNYIVIGTTANGDDILVYSFNGSTLSLVTSLNIGETKDVSWHPSKDYIIASTQSGVTIYKFNGSSLSIATVIVESSTFYSADWGNNNLFVIGKANSPSSEFRVYFFDDDLVEIFLVAELDHNGTLYSVSFSNDGNYIAVGDSIDDTSVYEANSYDTLIFDNTHIQMNSDLKFTTTTIFQGNCTINGKNHKLDLNDDGTIEIASGGNLIIQNTEIIGLQNKNLKCLTNDASLTLQDCKLTLSQDFEFDTGSILFKMDVTISGTNKFIYSSSEITTIDSNSTLIIKPGTTFKYAPQTNNRNLLYMTDQTSNLFLNGCTLHSTKTGLQLTNGTLTIDNKVTFSGEGTSQSEAICFGNNIAQNDLNIEIYADAEINIYGRLEYENTN